MHLLAPETLDLKPTTKMKFWVPTADHLEAIVASITTLMPQAAALSTTLVHPLVAWPATNTNEITILEQQAKPETSKKNNTWHPLISQTKTTKLITDICSRGRKNSTFLAQTPEVAVRRR